MLLSVAPRRRVGQKGPEGVAGGLMYKPCCQSVFQVYERTSASDPMLLPVAAYRRVKGPGWVVVEPLGLGLML